jgi:plastocyanin
MGCNARMKLVAAVLATLLACSGASAASLEIKASQRDGKPLADAVVTIEGESATLPPAAPVHAVMDQVKLTFVPHVLVVPVDSTVQFPNSDPVSHQVYSFSNTRSFQLPLYRGKPYPPVTFDKPGIVTLGCNIHDNMLGYIVVTAAPFFGRTDTNGAWTAGALPAGRLRVTLWHPLINEAPVVQTIDVTGTRSIELRLSKRLKPAPHTGKPKSWDY